MKPARPYLVRALYEWILANDLTPHLLIDPGQGVQVPPQAVRDGRITLNISPDAVRELKLDDDVITFEARFSGQPFSVFVPTEAVRGIYARENGRGMLFPEDDNGPPPTDPDPDDPGRPNLRVVK